MEIPRERQPMIKKAAERSGFYDKEIQDMMADPVGMLKYEERPDILHFSGKAAEMLLRLVEGKETDWQAVVDFGAQLRALAPDSDYQGKSKGINFVDEELEYKSYEGRKARFGIELIFEEEQKLLLLKNIIEEAFFDGKLVKLKGQQAAALAFLTNQLAKLVDRMTPSVQKEFLFDAERMKKMEDDIIQKEVDRVTREKKHYEDSLVYYENEKIKIEERIFIASDPRVQKMQAKIVELAELRDKIKILIAAGGSHEEENRFYQEVSNLDKQIQKNFDVYMPIGWPDKQRMREIFRLMHDTLVRTGVAVSLQSFAHDVGAGRDYPPDSRVILERFVQNVEALPLARKSAIAIQPVVAYVRCYLSGAASGKLGEQANLKLLERKLVSEIEDDRRMILEDPQDKSLSRKRDDVVLGIARNKSYLEGSGDDRRLKRIVNSLNSLHSLRTGEEIGRRNIPGLLVADLYLIKNYLAEADMQSQVTKYSSAGDERKNLGRQEGMVDFFTYRFTGTEKTGIGFADAHIRKSLMPLAKAMVEFQLAKK